MKEKNLHRVPLSRRRFLALGAAAALGTVAGPAWAAPARERRIAFLNLHTGEFLQATYWQDGSYVTDELAAVNRVLRDHYNDTVGAIDPQLLDLLHLVQQRLGDKRPYQVVSGYRSPQTNRMLREHSSGVAKHSLHMEGRAVDIHLPHGDLERLLLAARNLHGGGIGFYPTAQFIHLDTGPFRTWNG